MLVWSEIGLFYRTLLAYYSYYYYAVLINFQKSYSISKTFLLLESLSYIVFVPNAPSGWSHGQKKNSSGESKKFSLMQYKLRDWGASKVGQLLRPLSTSYSECSEAGAEQKMLSKARITHNVWHRRCRRGFWLSWQNKCVRGFSAQVSIIIVTWKYIVHYFLIWLWSTKKLLKYVLYCYIQGRQ